jgi:hypothetical protein
MPDLTEEEMARYAARHGLTTLTPEHLARMRELATRVAQVGSSIPRMSDKADEPASIFRLPMAPRG